MNATDFADKALPYEVTEINKTIFNLQISVSVRTLK
jgi:hypothetical protein